MSGNAVFSLGSWTFLGTSVKLVKWTYCKSIYLRDEEVSFGGRDNVGYNRESEIHFIMSESEVV